ncbi:hypothetical protein [uncultured Devosia sp.]|uniref:hypothetical protein n=1 Tax=uncultured Devosia sp. TaxID=211434 RepID=UPI0035CB460C
MASLDAQQLKASGFARLVSWTGRSGRTYGLIGENLEHFAMTPSDLYLIAKGSHPLWVGSSADLVGDPLSRSRFRLALDCADRVFRLLTPGAESDHLRTIWDLEGAEPMQALSAA